MSRVIMTSKQLIERLQALEARPTYYKNKYPDNLCYVHNDGRTSADCVNLYKSLLNGYDVSNRTPGYFQSDLSNTGDVGEWGLEEQCTDLSQDFSKLKNGEPRLLYMEYWLNGVKHTHTGGFIGEVQKYGYIYNVIECTSSWNGGIMYSYVDEKGRRFKHKGGGQSRSWTWHGLMTKWVKYESQTIDELPDTEMKPVNPVPKPVKEVPGTHEGSTVAHYYNKEYSRSYKVIDNSGLNVRSGIGIGTLSKGVLPYGSMVTCYGYYDFDNNNDIWLYVQTKFGIGFCKLDYLQ